MVSSDLVAVVLLMTPLAPSVLAQRSESTASLLLRFDNEHDLSAKEHLLLTVTNKDAGAGSTIRCDGEQSDSRGGPSDDASSTICPRSTVRVDRESVTSV